MHIIFVEGEVAGDQSPAFGEASARWHQRVGVVSAEESAGKERVRSQARLLPPMHLHFPRRATVAAHSR